MCCGTLYKWSCMHVQTFWCRLLMNSYSTVGQVFCLLDNSILSACAVLVPAYAAYLTVFWWCITMTWATLHTLRKTLGSPVCVFKVNTPLCSLSAGLVDCAIDVHTSHSFFFSIKVHSLELEKQLVEDRNTLLIQQLDTLRRESESRMSVMEGTCYVCKLKMKVSLCWNVPSDVILFPEQLSSQKKHHAKHLQEMETSHQREVCTSIFWSNASVLVSLFSFIGPTKCWKLRE